MEGGKRSEEGSARAEVERWLAESGILDSCHPRASEDGEVAGESSSGPVAAAAPPVASGKPKPPARTPSPTPPSRLASRVAKLSLLECDREWSRVGEATAGDVERHRKNLFEHLELPSQLRLLRLQSRFLLQDGATAPGPAPSAAARAGTRAAKAAMRPAAGAASRRAAVPLDTLCLSSALPREYEPDATPSSPKARRGFTVGFSARFQSPARSPRSPRSPSSPSSTPRSPRSPRPAEELYQLCARANPGATRADYLAIVNRTPRAVHSPRSRYPEAAGADSVKGAGALYSCVQDVAAAREGPATHAACGTAAGGDAVFASSTSRGLGTDDERLAGLDPDSFVGPGRYDPYPTGATARALSIKGTPRWEAPKEHSFAAERLRSPGAGAAGPGPGTYVPSLAATAPRVPGFHYSYRMSFFTHDTTALTPQERATRDAPGPGQYFETSRVALPGEAPLAPFGSAAERLLPHPPNLVGGGSPEDVRLDGDEEAHEAAAAAARARAVTVRANARSVRGRGAGERLARERRARQEARREHRGLVASRAGRVRRERELGRADRLREKEARHERRVRHAAAKDARRGWITVVALVASARSVLAAVDTAKRDLVLARVRRSVAARTIQRAFRLMGSRARSRVRLLGCLQRLALVFSVNLRIRRKRRAAGVLGLFLGDVLDKRVSTGRTPVSVLHVVRAASAAVVKCQRFWRRARVMRDAQRYLLLHVWARVHNAPENASVVRPLRLSLGSSAAAGAHPPESAGPQGWGDAVSLAVKVPLLDRHLREIRRAYFRRVLKHRRRMEAWVAARSAAPEAEVEEARAFLSGRVKSAADLQERYRAEYMAAHPRPVFLPLSSTSPQQMVSLIFQGYKQQAVANSRDWITSGISGGGGGGGAGLAPAEKERALVAQEDHAAAQAAFAELKRQFSRTVEKIDRAAVWRLLRDGARLVDSGALRVDTPISASASTCLHTAAWFRLTDLVQLLLAYGADPNATNMKGNTPLHMVCENITKHGAVETLAMLCRAGGDVYVRNVVEGARPFDKAPLTHRRAVTHATFAIGASAGKLPAHTTPGWQAVWRASADRTFGGL